MIIFFSVPALLIVFVLLAFLGMADMLFTFLIDIVFALVMAGLSIWGFFLAFKVVEKAFEEERYMALLCAPLYVLSSIFIPYYIYSICGILLKRTNSAMLAFNIISVIILSLVYGSIYILTEVLTEIDFVNIVVLTCFVVIVFIAGIIAGVVTYHSWRKTALSEGIEESEIYIMQESAYAMIEFKTEDEPNQVNSAVRFPYVAGGSRYPFVKLKKGEKVYLVNGNKYIGKREMMTWKGIGYQDENYTDAVLVCNESHKKVGYVRECDIKEITSE